MRRAKLGAGVVLFAGLAAACSPSAPSPAPSPVDAAPTSTVTVPEVTTTTAPPETTTTTEPEPEPTTTTTLYDWGPVLCETAKHPKHHEPCHAHAPARTSTATTAPARMRIASTETVSGGWVIPDYIVQCESKGSWNAQNPSGAAGPYQLMPEHFGGQSALSQSREAQHAKAAELWAGGRGASHWQACL